MAFLSNPCIMTGVALNMQFQDRAVNGDLFLQGDQYIFNAVYDLENAVPVWFSPGEVKLQPRHIQLGLGCHYWERRGVFVIPLSSLTFSEAAFEYVKPALVGSDYIIREAARRITLFTNSATE